MMFEKEMKNKEKKNNKATEKNQHIHKERDNFVLVWFVCMQTKSIVNSS